MYGGTEVETTSSSDLCVLVRQKESTSMLSPTSTPTLIHLLRGARSGALCNLCPSTQFVAVLRPPRRTMRTRRHLLFWVVFRVAPFLCVVTSPPRESDSSSRRCFLRNSLWIDGVLGTRLVLARKWCHVGLCEARTVRDGRASVKSRLLL
uniref:Secreted protein n=1 Tax=Steinernema glaseri TaxID=37863 RepID=A0A1I7ZKW1_9BILA